MPIWILRRTRCLGPPCLRAFHSPSPSTLMPVLSTARQSLLVATRGDKQVQRPLRAVIRNIDCKYPLTTADGAEVRHGPSETRQPEEAFHKASRLPKCHPEQHFHGQASLDRGVTESTRSAPPAGRFGIPVHLGIKPPSHRYKQRLPGSGSSVTRGASAPHCRQSSSSSCRSETSVYSCGPATKLGSRHESLNRFVQQSPPDDLYVTTTHI